MLLAVDPGCPKGIIQWQHGKYVKNANGSLSLTPFEVDGRQLLSDPCNYQNSIYTRYNQTELFKVIHPSHQASPWNSELIVFLPDLRSQDRRIQQKSAPQPLRLRRRSSKPYVPSLQTTANVAHSNPEPDEIRYC